MLLVISFTGIFNKSKMLITCLNVKRSKNENWNNTYTCYNNSCGRNIFEIWIWNDFYKNHLPPLEMDIVFSIYSFIAPISW